MCRKWSLFCTKFGKKVGLLVDFSVLRTRLLFIKVFYTKDCLVLSLTVVDIELLMLIFHPNMQGFSF